MNFADQLADVVRQKGNSLCVGIDPRWESLPLSVRVEHQHVPNGRALAYEKFGLHILDLVAKSVPVVKLQSAFFEEQGPAGFTAQQNILQRAKALGLVTILDAKRGDIASTATAYAEAAFNTWNADALTVNPYLGHDAIEPFIVKARAVQRGLFVLVRTSNPGSGLFQNRNCEGRPLYQHVGEAVGKWNGENLGECGLGDVGAVVGATHPEELHVLRKQIPDVWFLVPGYGAQGGKASGLAAAFRSDGLGAIVNSSRGITFPFHPDDPKWEAAIVAATAEAVAALKFPR